ncbi:MAG: hypothetical protein PHS79_04195 [Patescibacteria group bacterium]|nr:hypothetical protein [Patescibacteria group bacterium]
MQMGLKFNKIGDGLQYNVYDLKNGRVLKIPKTTRERIATLKRWQGMKRHSKSDLDRTVKRAKKAGKLTNNVAKKIAQRLNAIDGELFGNPEFSQRAMYTQDKVMTLGEYILHHNSGQNRRILHRYAKSIIRAWEYGLGETVFNFSINSGINKKGKVIFIDLGEFTFNKARIRRIINTRRWLKSWSFTSMTDLKLKKHYQKVMEKELTLETLEKNWKNKL